MRDFQLAGRSPVYATNAMAATSMPLATLVAIDTLRAGGNALDAAVAATAVLGVIEPQSTGIGGDCFCLYKPAGRDVVAMNGSGRAPAAASVAALARLGVLSLYPTSPHTVTIPGAVAAWDMLLAAHGRKGLDELLQPAIHYAETGFVVAPRVAFDWALDASKLKTTGAHKYLPGGSAPLPGHVFRQPTLAKTLRHIAKHGAKTFYEGEIAARMVATLRARGGLHTEDDFASMRSAVAFVTPISARWRGHDVWECPPNGSGVAALMLLGILGGMRTPDGPQGPLRLHRHAEAARLVYRDRDAFIADPEHHDVPVARLLSSEYLGAMRALIDDHRSLPKLPQPGEMSLPVHKDTVYVSVVDRDGNACSFINSIFQGFGSGIESSEDGILLHNRGFSFSLDAAHPNAIAPNKRPMHTIIPGMLTQNGHAVMPFGVMGGHYQPVGQSWLLTNLLEFGMDIQEAIDCPRVMPRLGALQVEHGIAAATRSALTQLGHELAEPEEPLGGAQAVWIDQARGILIGGSDPRKDGCALGY
jgi:gamma-glutamyltranspeptidase/glutathione hydrolase